MAVFNGNHAFSSKRTKSLPVVKCPKNVRQALDIDKAYQNGIFKIEPKKKQTLYDRCYLFDEINYINKNKSEQTSFLTELMMWLNSMGVGFKITLANEYQNMEDFLASIRSEKNAAVYPNIAQGIRQWQEDNLEEVNPSVTKMRYLTVTSRADSEKNARVYLNALENTIMAAFEGWGSRIIKLNAKNRLCALQSITQPGRLEEQEYISFPDGKNGKRDWKNDILPRSIKQYKNFMKMGDTYVTVLFGGKYRKSIDSDTFIRNLSNTTYPSVLTLDFAPVETDIVSDKLSAAQMNNEREIADEMKQKRDAGIYAVGPSYPKERRKNELEKYTDLVDANDEKGFFMNLLLVLTAPDESTLAERIREMQAIGRKEGCVLETCDFRQLKAWNTALPIGGRQVDYMRFFLTSSLVAFQPYHAQDIIEPGGQMFGLNRTTKRFIIGNRIKLPNPHAIIIGPPGTGKSMLIKLTELSQTLLATDDDIIIIDPQNEFAEVCRMYGGSYFDLTPKSGVYLNGFEVSEEVFQAVDAVQQKFIAKQTEYAKSLCAAAMKRIVVTQEHDSVISRCTERMFKQVFAQKRLKKQPTLVWLREEIKKDLDKVKNTHDDAIIRPIYNCLEEYTHGSCDMLAKPSNIRIDNRLTGFGMADVPENNWEAVMVTILHYLSARMDYNIELQKATHLIVDETQVVSKKPGSAKQLNDAVLTFRKFGGIVTMAMQNVTAALSNPMLTELFENCSYKCFFDQGGVDANALAAIQKFSAKEFQALSSGRVGEGVMVWNKKVVLFDAKIEKTNVLYAPYNTNFHEKAENHKKQQSRNGEKEIEMQDVPDSGTRNLSKAVEEIHEEKSEDGAWKEHYQSVLKLAEMTEISEMDIEQILHLSKEESISLLAEMVKDHLLVPIGNPEEGRYRKAA